MDLSAFWFDIRKDALYCDAPDSPKRRACRTVMNEVFLRLTTWMAPILVFTMEEVWLQRFPGEESSVHLQDFPETPDWRDDELAAKWAEIRRVRRVVTGAIEVERREKRIGASLEAKPVVHVADAATRDLLGTVDFAEICITSQIDVTGDAAPGEAFMLDGTDGIAVQPTRTTAQKWRTLLAIAAGGGDVVGSQPVSALLRGCGRAVTLAG